MAITAVKPSARLLAFLMVTLLTGCGLTQTVKDGAVSVTQSIFTPVKTLHLDLRAREGVNNNAKGASGDGGAYLSAEGPASVRQY